MKATRDGETTGASSILFLFSSLILLTLFPDYLLFSEVGLGRQRSGRQRFDRRRNRRECIICALLGGSVFYRFFVLCSLLLTVLVF